MTERTLTRIYTALPRRRRLSAGSSAELHSSWLYVHLFSVSLPPIHVSRTFTRVRTLNQHRAVNQLTGGLCCQADETVPEQTNRGPGCEDEHVTEQFDPNTSMIIMQLRRTPQY